MLGSILSNILLVLGCCFLAGGIREQERSFNETVASTMSSLMAVASASLIIPATLYAVMKQGDTSGHETDKNILVLSHGTAIILLILYVLYLYFQLYSHHNLFADVEGQGGDSEEEDGQILSPVAAGVALVVVTVMVAICAEFLVNSIDSIVESLLEMPLSTSPPSSSPTRERWISPSTSQSAAPCKSLSLSLPSWSFLAGSWASP
jgi:Ca2+:H+ antiporter